MVRQVIREQLDLSTFVSENITEQEESLNIFDPLPPEVWDKLRSIATAYMNGEVRLYSVQNVFKEVSSYLGDPMEAVEIVYNELNKAASGEELEHVSDRATAKAQKAYSVLIDLAHQERLYQNYGL